MNYGKNKTSNYHISNHTDSHTNSYDLTVSHGTTWYDTNDHTWHIYDTTAGNATWIAAPGTHTHDTVTWDGKIEPSWFIPVRCPCCERMIKEEDDGLSLKIGEKTMWFHRQCFAHPKYAKLIRSLVVSEDLELF